MGPLALSIALFRNALVFHSADHMTILAVHIDPLWLVMECDESGLGYFGESFKPAVYMAIHGSLCFLSFILSQLLWRSFWLNTVYLLGLLLVSVWNGSTYYFEVFATKKDKAKATPSSSDENKLQPTPIEESKLQ
eukprot:gene27573-36372_t